MKDKSKKTKNESMYELKKPCPSCPFRKNTIMKLSENRLPTIVRSIESNSIFPCHNTIDYEKQTDENSDNFIVDHEKNKMCAGAMIFMKKDNRYSRRLELAEEAGYIKHEDLMEHADCVIDSLDEREIHE
ncbi:hypothetical protein [Bacillus bombysepticus]|uniref:hypothetical protein n=1 Tax=Bacillus bombysepticus TaxID=658666 RepID=UPI00301AE8FD